MPPTSSRLSRIETLIRQLQGRLRWGTGDPNGTVDAPTGAIYQDDATRGAVPQDDGAR
jgi:hypothetical protein